MSKLYTCDDCGYALLTEETVAKERLIVWTQGVGWHLGELVHEDPITCGSRYDCMRRRRDKVAGRRVLRNIDRRHARQFPALY